MLRAALFFLFLGFISKPSQLHVYGQCTTEVKYVEIKPEQEEEGRGRIQGL